MAKQQLPNDDEYYSIIRQKRYLLEVLDSIECPKKERAKVGLEINSLNVFIDQYESLNPKLVYHRQ